jgi:2-phosphosulfolactate phosphatase
VELVTATRTIKVDAFPENASRYLEYDAIVCIDVILATTTLVTAVAQGRRAYPVRTEDEARGLAAALVDPLLAGDAGGRRPEGFDLGSGPAGLARRADVDRPLVLFSAPGTTLILAASGTGTPEVNAGAVPVRSQRDRGAAGPSVYVACFRNLSATAEAAACHQRVAVLGAGYAGEFRCEDQMASAWLARSLMQRGFDPTDHATADLVKRWAEADISLAGWGKSAEYLRRLGQREDLDFVLSRLDDLDLACRCEHGEVRTLEPAASVDVPSKAGDDRQTAAPAGKVVPFDRGRRRAPHLRWGEPVPRPRALKRSNGPNEAS